MQSADLLLISWDNARAQLDQAEDIFEKVGTVTGPAIFHPCRELIGSIAQFSSADAQLAQLPLKEAAQGVVEISKKVCNGIPWRAYPQQGSGRPLCPDLVVSSCSSTHLIWLPFCCLYMLLSSGQAADGPCQWCSRKILATSMIFGRRAGSGEQHAVTSSAMAAGHSTGHLQLQASSENQQL